MMVAIFGLWFVEDCCPQVSPICLEKEKYFAKSHIRKYKHLKLLAGCGKTILKGDLWPRRRNDIS